VHSPLFSGRFSETESEGGCFLSYLNVRGIHALIVM
jgi:hypothetical protein